MWVHLKTSVYYEGYSSGSSSRARGNATNSPPAILEAADRTRVDVATVEEQVVGVARTARRRRPVVPVGATTVHRTTADEAGIDEVVRISSKFI